MPGSTEDHWGRQDAAQAIALVSSLLPSLSVFTTMYFLVFSCGFAQADGVYLLGCQDHVACGDSKTKILYIKIWCIANSQMGHISIGKWKLLSCAIRSCNVGQDHM